MKNIKWLSGVFIMALGLLAFSACSDDDDNVKLTFPEKQAIDCSVGEVKTLTFDAEYPWTLSSSRLWCKFKDGNDIVASLSGEAGHQTVSITVTEDVWGFEDAVAEIIIGMEGQTQVIAMVNRAKKNYKLEAYKMEGNSKVVYNEENPMILPYGSRPVEIEINIDANFDWKVENCPEWLSVLQKVGNITNTNQVNMMGDADKLTTWVLSFKPSVDFSKGKEHSENLKIVDLNGFPLFTLPIKYQGIETGKIEFDSNWWNWVFSADGKWYWSSSGVGGTQITKKPMPRIINVITRDDFKLIYVDYNSRFGYTPYADTNDWYGAWFTASANGDQISVEVEPNSQSDERKGYLLAIPTSIYEREFKDNLDKLLESDYSAITFENEKYIVTELTQEGVRVGGFEVMDFNGVAYELEYIGNDYDASAAYGTNNIYQVKLEPSTAYSLTVTPQEYMEEELMYKPLDQYNPWPGVQLEKDNFSLNILNIPAEEGMLDIIFLKGDGTNFGVLRISKYGDY